ncbi:hypothetical protein SVAN01_05511 [Stagonosporopsis vannaccii]|nr:hypothetical protein SVAN01_05511 [Stagonosporopsis vannaccii]
MNPRVGKPWTKKAIREVINDAYFYEKFRECVTTLTSTTLPLLDLLSIDFGSVADFKYLAAETRAMCTDLDRSWTQLITRIESSMQLFELLRSFHESSNLRLLGLLAAIFLPLSLASSLLSMQTRLADLHYLLYDFFGVIVLLGTIVLLIVVLLRLYARLKDKFDDWNFDPDNNHTRWRSFSVQYTVVSLLAVSWTLLLASFLVGMVKDVPLGLKILGYGFAAMGGWLCVVGLGAILVEWLAAKL